MRTVQEILRELDTEKLIDTYLYDNPIRYEEWLEDDLTVAQIRNGYRKRLEEFIERLRTMQIREPDDGRKCLFYVHRCIKDEFDDVSFHLIYVDELLEKGYDCQSYAYEFEDQAEIVGYLVAETPMMKRHIYDLMSEVMCEASFFGFEQQHLQEEKDELDRRIKEVEDGTAELESWESVRKELDLEDFDQESEDEKELHDKVWEARLAYSEHSSRKELDAVKALLEAEKP